MDSTKAEQELLNDPMQFLTLQELIPAELQGNRIHLRQSLARVVQPIIHDFVERAEFPFSLVPELRKLNIVGTDQIGYGVRPISNLEKALILYELSRVDAGLATFYVVQVCLALRCIELLGSPEQKHKYLRPLATFDKIGCFALTEPSHGSDASGLVSTATPVKGGYLINGSKRWIGNASFSDIIIVFARDTVSRKVKSFIVDSRSSGITTNVIKRKLAMRPVMNCDIHFKDVFVPEENRLVHGDGFTEGVNRVLNSSRMFVPWLAIGLMGGVYETAIKYAKKRIQFQVPIASFQIIQEKLVRMLGYFNACFLQGWRLMVMDKCDVAQSAAVKSQITLIGREVTKLAREILGGNGILIENNVMKAMLDMEALYTYEGTYEINALAVGRAITGIPAFKSSYKL